jgi:hypothetical protein
VRAETRIRRPREVVKMIQWTKVDCAAHLGSCLVEIMVFAKKQDVLFRHPLKISILVWLGITTRYYTSCFHRFQLIPSCDMSILKCFP